MRFKIKDELKGTDYKRLTEFLEENPDVTIALLPRIDLGFLSLSPIVVAVEGFGYRIKAEILFEQTIGFEVYDDLKPNSEMASCFEANRKNFKLSKIVMEPTDLDKDLNMILRAVERIINLASSRFGRLIEQTHTIDSERLDREFGVTLRKEELEKRDEIARPFGTIHARDSKDAKERAGDFVPVYMERDKAYLYEDKKVFMLLPRTFAMKLLKLEGPTMIGADQFTEDEREVLQQFCLRQYVRTSKVGGKVCYSDLDETTRKLILKRMRKSKRRE